MAIRQTKRFRTELKAVFDFISKDSRVRAKEFKDQLITKIEQMPDQPFKCRQSLKFNDESVRDLIFKSYVIPYAVESEAIYLLGIYKANKWEAK